MEGGNEGDRDRENKIGNEREGKKERGLNMREGVNEGERNTV